MRDPFLWFIDFHGSLYKYIIHGNQWQRISRENENSRKDTFKRISSTSSCAWSIGSDQNVYVCVLQTDLPIKVKVSTYENQRWSVRHGWSEKGLLFTDRWNWSTKNGKTETRQSSFHLPSDSWRWEGNWFVDESIDCDVEGWQYALDFPAHYHKKPGCLSFVRRRKWSRYRQFVSFDTWIKVPSISKEDPFQDITIGGHQIPGQFHGFLCVWAITFSGKVMFRSGVTRSCPEGEKWICVEKDEINLVQISVGPTGFLWGCTWDGHSVVRQGITHTQPMGTSWAVIKAPAENPLFQVAVGAQALWAIAKNFKVYFRRGVEYANSPTLNKKGSCNWVEMFGSFLFVSVGPNEQVWAIGAEDRRLYVRTHVTMNELVGREWKMLKLQGENSENNHGAAALQWYWIDSGSCEVDSTYFSKSRLVSQTSNANLANPEVDAAWRNKVMTCLCDRNRKESDGAESYEAPCGALSQVPIVWSKRSSCQILLDAYYDAWRTCHVKLLSDISENNDSLLVYFNRGAKFEELIFFCRDFTCIHQIQNTHLNTFAVQLLSKTKGQQVVVFQMENEKTMKEWMSALSERMNVKSEQPDVVLLATSALGDVFSVKLRQSTLSLQDLHLQWQVVEGYLKKVVSGYGFTTWGMSHNGKVYVNLYDQKKHYEHKSIVEHVIYENQRWNPIEGYTNRLLPSDRWSWSDKAGQQNCARDIYRLPSLKHGWIDEWNIAYSDKTDPQGWKYAADFPRQFSRHRGINDYVRRRKWKRSAQVSWKGPWLEIQSDVNVMDVSVPIDDSSLVWAVSCNGDVMVRSNVSKDCPQGTTWDHLPTDIPVRSVSVGVKSRVWCVNQDGSCYVRGGFSCKSIFGTNWFHVLKDEYLVREVSVGEHLVLAIDSQGNLVQRCDVSDAYPEGTRWQPLFENVSSVSVNRDDTICFVQDGNVKLCCADNYSNLRQCATSTLLHNGWRSICCRSTPAAVSMPKLEEEESPQYEPHTETVRAEGDDDQHTDTDDDETEESSVKVDPYAIDIYSFYKAKE